MSHHSPAFTILLAFLALLLVIAAGSIVAGRKAHGAETKCLTRAQAQAKYPSAWLYWHTSRHCWDDHKSRSRQPAPAPDPPDANGNAVHQTIAYPELMTGAGVDDTMLRPDPMSSWPLIADFDDDRPAFLPWRDRIVLH